MTTSPAAGAEPFRECEASLTDLTLVGSGRTAEVYAWGDGEVIKLFHEGRSEEPARREALATRIAYDAGLPAPAIGGLVRIAGRYGICYERIAGRTLLANMRARIWRVRSAGRMLGALHAAMHLANGTGLMPLTDQLRWNLTQAPGISEELRGALQARLAEMPEGQALCHGDFHPDNVVITARGPVIIDWLTAVCGNPLADVARTTLLIQSGAPPEAFGPIEAALINLARHSMYAGYLASYRRSLPASPEAITAWLPIMAAARLTEGIPESEKVWLRQVAAKALD